MDADLRLACYHEAGHAVFCRRAGYRTRHVSVSTRARPDLPDRCRHDFPARPKIPDVLAFLLISMAGPYAEYRATHGEPMPHRPYGVFLECVEEDARDFEADFEEIPSGSMNALEMIRLATKGGEDARSVEEKLYVESCRQVAAHVEEFWPEIEAVAERLSEVGYLEGEEVGRIIDGVRAAASHEPLKRDSR